MMHQFVGRAVVGAGESSLVLEVRGASVRIKRRGAPDLFVPLERAEEVARFLLAAVAPSPLRA